MEQDNEYRRIKFDNRINPLAQFDFLYLKEIFTRKGLDHDPSHLHRLDFYLIVLITSGRGKHVVDFQEYTLEVGTVLTIRKDQLHKFVNTGAEGGILLFTHDYLVEYLEQLESIKTLQLFNEMLGKPKVLLDAEELEEIIRLIDDIKTEYFIRKDEQSLGIIRSLLQVIISKLYRAKSDKGQIIKDKKYLEPFITFQSLVEQKCLSTKKVGDYAKLMGVTSKTLNNIVRSIVDKSAKTFIDEVVITQIKRMLIHTSMHITEVAYAAGFEEPSNMYKYFKKHTQYTPDSFRKTFS